MNPITYLDGYKTIIGGALFALAALGQALGWDAQVVVALTLLATGGSTVGVRGMGPKIIDALKAANAPPPSSGGLCILPFLAAIAVGCGLLGSPGNAVQAAEGQPPGVNPPGIIPILPIMPSPSTRLVDLGDDTWLDPWSIDAVYRETPLAAKTWKVLFRNGKQLAITETSAKKLIAHIKKEAAGVQPMIAPCAMPRKPCCTCNCPDCQCWVEGGTCRCNGCPTHAAAAPVKIAYAQLPWRRLIEQGHGAHEQRIQSLEHGPRSAPQTAPQIIVIPTPPGVQQSLPITPPQQTLPINPPQQVLPITPPQQTLPILPPQHQLLIGPPQQQLPIGSAPQQTLPTPAPVAPMPQIGTPAPGPQLPITVPAPGPQLGPAPAGPTRYTWRPTAKQTPRVAVQYAIGRPVK